MSWNMFWVLIMHRQWTHGAADWLQHRLNLPICVFRGAEHPPSVTPPVWDPAQIMSVGIWTNIVACEGGCLIWEMECILAGS